ncbi:MAG: hypothetical protein MZV65_17880 [Chromatiales bacterium]|nr:hypothetical protein [Chromatiales bacterium]
MMEAGVLMPETHQDMLLGDPRARKDQRWTTSWCRAARSKASTSTPTGTTSPRSIGSSRFTRLPVYRGSLDQIAGLVHLRKVLRPDAHRRLQPRIIAQADRRAAITSREGTPLSTALLNFRARHGGASRWWSTRTATSSGW